MESQWVPTAIFDQRVGVMTSPESGDRERNISSSSRDIDVLLVDDDETWARTQQRVLERHHDAISVSTAHSLDGAQTHLNLTSPDCLVCDYQLGDGTGLELLETVRTTSPTLPFILVTGQGDESVASTAIGEHVTDYVRKSTLGSQPALLAKRVEAIVTAHRTQRSLERERRSKETLLELVTASTTGRDLGHDVCHHLVTEHQYDCVWIGVLDDDRTVVPLSKAGSTGYLETVLSPGLEPDTGTEPALTALANTDAVVSEQIDPTNDAVSDVESSRDDRVESNESVAHWRQVAFDHGLRSAAAVPVEHDGVQFGVLSVYDSSSHRFEDSVVDFLSEFGETIGYALQATEWRRTLFASTATRVEITTATESSPLVALSQRLPRRATIEVTTLIPRNDDEVLYLASIDGSTVAELDEAQASVAAIRSVEEYATGDTLRCGLVVETPTPETLAVAAGARFQRTEVANGNAQVTAVVRSTDSVRNVVTGLKAVFADASVTTVWSDLPHPSSADETVIERLTDRQRQVLELAVDTGYFERPREHNTGELAGMLDISRATFTQHLRAAQLKLFEGLL